MNEPKLGKIITDVVHRDAVHFALAPVVASERLKPGEHLRFVTTGNTELVIGVLPGCGIGVVDPFLTKAVEKGEQFWMMLYPGTITSLRHEWTHPAFEDQRNIAEWWMREYWSKVPSYDPESAPSFEDFMVGLKEYAQGVNGDIAYLGVDIDYDHTGDPVKVKEFWKYAQMLVGPIKKERMHDDHVPFRCAC